MHYYVIVKLFPVHGQEICTSVQVKHVSFSRHEIYEVSPLNILHFVDMNFFSRDEIL